MKPFFSFSTHGTTLAYMELELQLALGDVLKQFRTSLPL